MPDIRIDPEFESLIFPLTEEEFNQLRENIISEGRVRDALILWDGVILDGHNRWKILQENPQISYRTEEMHFETRNEAKAWMIRNQLGRRNLPMYERAKLALQLKPLLAEAAKKRMVAGKADPVQKSAQGKVRDELAKIAGVSHDTIEKVQVIERSATPEEKQKLSKGETTVNKVFNAVRERVKPHGYTKEDRIDRAKTEAVIADMIDTSNVREMTVEMLVDDIVLNAEEYVRSLRNVLTDHSTLLTDESRPIIAEAIQKHILDKIIFLKGVVERK